MQSVSANDFPPVFNAMLEGLRRQGLAELEEIRAIEDAAADAGEVRALARKLREKKEAQLGLSRDGGASENEDQEPISVAVH